LRQFREGSKRWREKQLSSPEKLQRYREKIANQGRKRTQLETAAVAFLKQIGVWEPGPSSTVGMRRRAAAAYVRDAGLLPSNTGDISNGK
jgi:hypothetical protein